MLALGPYVTSGEESVWYATVIHIKYQCYTWCSAIGSVLSWNLGKFIELWLSEAIILNPRNDIVNTAYVSDFG